MWVSVSPKAQQHAELVRSFREQQTKYPNLKCNPSPNLEFFQMSQGWHTCSGVTRHSLRRAPESAVGSCPSVFSHGQSQTNKDPPQAAVTFSTTAFTGQKHDKDKMQVLTTKPSLGVLRESQSNCTKQRHKDKNKDKIKTDKGQKATKNNFRQRRRQRKMRKKTKEKQRQRQKKEKDKGKGKQQGQGQGQGQGPGPRPGPGQRKEDKDKGQRKTQTTRYFQKRRY